jgi:hypothetical protein
VREALAFWRKRVSTETAWHQIGFVEAVRRQEPAPPWLSAARSPTSDLDRCAQIARLLIEFLERPGILAAASAALEYTPARWLTDHAFTAASGMRGEEVLVKSHSFERVRLVYARAIADAGIAAE